MQQSSDWQSSGPLLTLCTAHAVCRGVKALEDKPLSLRELALMIRKAWESGHEDGKG